MFTKTSACIAAVLLLFGAFVMSEADARGGGRGGGGGGHSARSGGGGGHSARSGGGRSYSARSYSGSGGRSYSARSYSGGGGARAPRTVTATRSYTGGNRTLQARTNSGSQGNRTANISTAIRNSAVQNNVRNNSFAARQWQGSRVNTAARASVSRQRFGHANLNGQRFGLASVHTSHAARTLTNRFLANRPGAGKAFALATFHGHWANWGWRHRYGFFRRSFVIGWLGPLYWPYAYDDFISYTFYPHAHDSFWPYAYDDLYAGVFGHYAYGYRNGGGGGQPVVATNICSGEKSSLTDWPIEQIALAVEPNETQRTALEALRAATGQALDILKTACPTDLPSTPTGRLEGMRIRLDVMLAAVRTVRPALETFYQSLNDEQKARFNSLGPEESAGQQQAQRDLAQMCSERAAGVTELPIDRIEAAVRPNDVQRVALSQLRDAVVGAVNLLKTDCPTYQALTPIGRTEAMEQRLGAMMRAVQSVQPALMKFYGSLNDEQKERFNRLSPTQQASLKAM